MLVRRGVLEGVTGVLGRVTPSVIVGLMGLVALELKVAGALRRLAAFTGEGGCCEVRGAPWVNGVCSWGEETAGEPTSTVPGLLLRDFDNSSVDVSLA
jgi:hypothetical protein